MKKNIKQHIKRTILITFFTALLTIILSGCMLFAVGGVGASLLSMNDRRTAGTIIDDNSIEFALAKETSNILGITKSHITVTSYNLNVLITGEVLTQEDGILIEEKVRRLSKVNKVYNELIVASPASLASRSNDTLITSKVKSALITVIDPLNIKVVTERGIVHLMGIVTRDESAKVLERVRETVGSQNVIHFFEYFTMK